MTDVENPRAVVGDNVPDYGAEVTAQLRMDYPGIESDVTRLLDDARALGQFPGEGQDAELLGGYAKLVKDFRDLTKRLETFHATAKEPHLRRGQATDQFFFSLIDKCARRQPKNKPGAVDVLISRMDDYNQRLLREEQARRAREAAEQARVAREAQEKAAREEKAAEEARLAAERARKPETIEQKSAAASEAEERASVAQAEAAVAADRATDAHVQTLARPADLVRTRTEGGPMVTMGSKTWALVTDSALLDKEALWPFISEAEKEKALRAWAKNNGHTKTMPGADVGKGARTKVI